MNKVTKGEREALIAEAENLLRVRTRVATEDVLMTRHSISRQRSRHAVTKAILRMRGQGK